MTLAVTALAALSAVLSSCPKTLHPVIASGFNILVLTMNKM